MGIFTDRNGEAKVGNIVGGALATLFTIGVAADSVIFVSPREAVIQTDFSGNIIRVIDKTGVYAKTPIITSTHSYSLTRETALLKGDTSLRTSDDVRLSNPFTVEFEIDETVDLKKLYIDSKGKNVTDIVLQRAKDAAVRVFETLKVSDLAEPGVTDRIKALIKEKLQNDLTQEGWPIKIRTVLSDGFKLNPGSEDELERIVILRQEGTRLDLRSNNADKALSIMSKEAASDAAYLSGLKAAGVPNEGLVCALYLKKLSDTGKVGIPFVAGCNTNSPAIAVPAPSASAPAAAPTPGK